MQTNLYWCERDQLVLEAKTPEGHLLCAEYTAGVRDMLPNVPRYVQHIRSTNGKKWARNLAATLQADVTYSEKDDVIRFRRELLFGTLKEALEWARRKRQLWVTEPRNFERLRAEHFAELMSHSSQWDRTVEQVRVTTITYVPKSGGGSAESIEGLSPGQIADLPLDSPSADFYKVLSHLGRSTKKKGRS